MLFVFVRIFMALSPKRTRDLYWDEHRGDPFIKQIMSKTMFSRMFRCICMYDPTIEVPQNVKDEKDNSYKVTGMLEKFNETSQHYYHLSKDLAFDETMIWNFCKSGLNQKIKVKPIYHGFEVIKLTNKHSYNFYELLICNNTSAKLIAKKNECEKNKLNKGGQMVLVMLEEVGLRNDNHFKPTQYTIYVDVGFTNHYLFDYVLDTTGVFMTGIARSNASGLQSCPKVAKKFRNLRIARSK